MSNHKNNNKEEEPSGKNEIPGNFETLFNSIQDAIFIFDAKGNILEANKQACSRLNYTKRELLKLTPFDIDGKRFAEDPYEVIQKIENEGSFKGETVHITKNGIRIPTEINANKIVYEGESAILAVARDITVRKEYEKELLDAKNKAEESAKLKSAFLANLSHEIRTPLNAILGFSDLLNMEIQENDQKKEFVSMIRRSGNKLLGIINDILDVSFIESGQIQFDKQSFSLNTLVDDLKVEVQEKIENAGKNIQVTVHKYFKDEEDVFYNDKHKIHQIYSKLLDNAVKFTNKGNVEFGYLYRGKGTIEFYVKDTGIGIPKGSKSLIFERFIQLDSGMDRQFQGLGLGLSIAKGIVDQLGGYIEVDSLINKGTTMSFKLPYQSGDKPSDRTSDGEVNHTIDLSGKKILIAEDDPLNFNLIREMFVGGNVGITGNIEIIHAGDGEEAIERYKESDEINFVLMDIKMPVMDGIEALAKIKEISPDVPVIALTAYAYENDKKSLLEKGFDYYISKPVNHSELKKIIRKISLQ